MTKTGRGGHRPPVSLILNRFRRATNGRPYNRVYLKLPDKLQFIIPKNIFQKPIDKNASVYYNIKVVKRHSRVCADPFRHPHSYSFAGMCGENSAIPRTPFAGMAELADAPDLGSGISDVQVQALSGAPYAKNPNHYGSDFLYSFQ